MGANQLLAYVGHEGIIFQSPYFQDVCIWDTRFANSVAMPMQKLWDL